MHTYAKIQFIQIFNSYNTELFIFYLLHPLWLCVQQIWCSISYAIFYTTTPLHLINYLNKCFYTLHPFSCFSINKGWNKISGYVCLSRVVRFDSHVRTKFLFQQYWRKNTSNLQKDNTCATATIFKGQR